MSVVRRRIRARLRPFVPPWLVTAAVGLLIALWAIRGIETGLRPLLAPLAETEVHRQVTALVEEACRPLAELSGGDYSHLVTIHRDGEGQIESLSADAAAMNQLRLQAVSRVTEALSRETGAAVAIPLGSLLGSSLFWARGPAIPVHALTAGTAHGEFESTFTEAGINQTLHRIELVLTVPVTILLPGGPAGVEVTARVTVAETVIVGRIPETYLRAGAGSPL